MPKRKIAIFTGNRAEYGLQLPILKAVDQHPSLDYQLIVSGAHLSDDYGNTLEEIKADGFHIDAQVNIEMGNHSKTATSHAIGSGIINMCQALNTLQPDVLVVYADRFEGFAAVIAATQMNIATAHIEGGDLTEGGALDDSVRHAMTKLAHLHFTTNKQSATRLLAMGEEPWRVHNSGFPAIDMIAAGEYSTAKEICTSLNLNIEKPIVLFTQHSVSTESHSASEQLQPSLNTLIKLANSGVQIIATYPNNDAGSHSIIEQLKQLKKKRLRGIQIHPSLGRQRYHGVLALAKNSHVRIACMGNSSSGLKETPAFGCPTVNIGSRQRGRLRGENVIDTGYNENDILQAINCCLFDINFRKRCRLAENPYYLGNAGIKIAEILSSVDIDNRLLQKAMTLRGETQNGWFR